jgi:hypothetical protein
MGVRDRGVKRPRAWWTVSAHEARQHALVLAVATWLVSIITTFGASGPTSLLGVLNAPDFVHFYTFGLLAREGRIRDAYDWQAFHAAQVRVVPESAQSVYPPVYPPQAAVVFIPFSRLTFRDAAAAWTAITILGYVLIVWVSWRRVREWLPDPVLVLAASAGFPPFWHVVMNGQVTIIILAACFLGWLALEHGLRFWAGVALGLLAIKPQFGLPFAVIVLVQRDWKMLSGAIASVGIQASIVWLVLGNDAFTGYAAMLPVISAHADELEPKPFQSHSIRAVTRLLPAVIGMPLWIGTVGVVLWKTAQAWTSTAPLAVRFGIAMLAAVLVNPHLIVYDAAILVLPLMWFGAWLVQQRTTSDESNRLPLTVANYGALVYALVLAFLAPTAALIRVQVSVLLMLWVFWRVQDIVLTTPAKQWAKSPS